MQPPPQISPDGVYWWDGLAWQLMPGYAPPVVAADPARPQWLPETVAVPTPSAPPGLPLISGPAQAGAFTPVWAATPVDNSLPPMSTTRKVVLWAGTVVGAGILLFGLVAVPASLAQYGAARSAALTGSVAIIFFGAVILAPCLGVLMGFGPAVSGTFHSLGILGCIVVVGMVLNTVAAVSSPVGPGRWALPWGTVVLVIYRAMRGRWLGAGIITVVWMIGGAITLTMSHA